MQRFARLFPKVLFLVFGTGIVVVSLLSTNRAFSQGDGLELTNQRFYFQEVLLPDHILYPVFMAADSIKLKLSDPEEAVSLRIAYAWRRLEHAQSLLKKGYQGLAFSTLSKGYKYHNAAVEAAYRLSLTEAQQQALIVEAGEYRSAVTELFPSFSDTERGELLRLEAEQTALLVVFD